MEHETRLLSHAAVLAALGDLSDEQLRDRLASATALTAGIGGAAALLDVDGARVFVKRLAVTDVERQPGNVGNTANLFGLPPWCHYGVGAASWGAWRELSIHDLTTQWVLDGHCDAFPLLHHWRLLPTDTPLTLDCAQHGDLETWVAFCHGSDAVRQRLEALAEASAELWLFLEYVPQNLLAWLTDKLGEGVAAVDAALARVESQLVQVAAFMAANDVYHFDAHLRNILADDDGLYVSDFGLAASSSFELTASEAAFLDQHLEHDLAYVVTEIVNWIATRLTEAAATWTHPRERNDFVRACADGYAPPELPPAAAAIMQRYSPVAAVKNDFYSALYATSRLTPYPADAVREACAASGISVSRASV